MEKRGKGLRVLRDAGGKAGARRRAGCGESESRIFGVEKEVDGIYDMEKVKVFRRMSQVMCPQVIFLYGIRIFPLKAHTESGEKGQVSISFPQVLKTVWKTWDKVWRRPGF